MGKRRRREPAAETLIPTHEIGESIGAAGGVKERNSKGEKFIACYLLTSLCPRFKGQTYIGFTVDPRRRIRQHNGEIGSGAWRTRRKRPWEMVLCIYGFPSNVAALQFEWAWQHPRRSLVVRAAAASFKSVSGLVNKIKLAVAMLSLPAWQSLNLTMNFFSTRYETYISGCPGDQIRMQVCSIEGLPCYGRKSGEADKSEGVEEFSEEKLHVH
ncbi:uncharacterized protein LOC127259559 [Andrographis paniculata]|uniref:uncharacterized protein LOC127259559 n=1 Tax=Andrographis paniculata TaxID=175694 RepID=UPI0021E83C49|nr:uncharacterized protein LOC127259559 [Andrographis paniculata]